MKLSVFAVAASTAVATAALTARPAVNIVFPPAGGAVATEGRTFVIGSVQPPSAPLTVNGQPVTPWRTGGFLLMTAVTPGTNTLLVRTGDVSLRHVFFVPPRPEGWNGQTLRALEPLQPEGVCTGETIRLACLAPAGSTVRAAVGERTVVLAPRAAAPTCYSADIAFPDPVMNVPVTYFADGLADAAAAALTARAEWPVCRVTGPLFETRARSAAGDGDTLAFLPPGLRLQGAGFRGGHTRLWLDGTRCYVDTRHLVAEPAGAAPPPRDLPAPELAVGPKPAPTGPRRPSDLLIVLDPGHGGAASGAIGPTGLAEKTATLEQARAVSRVLEAAGFRTRLTRADDTDVDLYERCRIAYAAKADAFISLHYNATRPSANPDDARGVETFAWNSIGERLARALHPQIAAATPVPNRGVSRASFAVCRNPAVPSCLLELDFITCPEGEEAIRQPERQQRVAEAILAGLCDWINQPRPARP